MRRRQELYGFAPDPAMPQYPFHPESRNTAIALCRFDGDGLVEAGYLPCWIDDTASPVPLAGPESGPVVDYVDRITAAAGLNGRFVRRGDELLLTGAGRTS